MRYVSLFSGIEAASLAWEPLGLEPVAFCEIDEFPSAVLAARWPDVPNLGDITKVDWREFKSKHGAVDIVVGGSPCFPAGTLVLCEGGYKPIEQVEVGDLVVTHRGRLKRVLATGSKVADTIVLKGQGSVGIECTENHPFWSRGKNKVWDNDKRSYGMVPDGESRWVKAADMQGRFWLNVCSVERTPVPRLAPPAKGERGGGYVEDFEFSQEFFYFVGRWLGDGWANAHMRKGRVESLMKRVYVCCPYGGAQDLARHLVATGLHFSVSAERTTVRFVCSSTQLHDWLVGNFGVHADGKNIPAWCLGMREDWRSAMLMGYLESDGTKASNGHKATTISRTLSLGIKALAGTLGMATSINYCDLNRDVVIEGRRVNEHPFYVSSYYDKSRSAFFAETGFFGKVRKVLPGRKNVTVHNLEVEDDNSYTADGIAVHNCQSFSIAGGRESLRGESRLMFEYIRAVGNLRPEWFAWENVPGCLSTRDDAFGQLLQEMEDLGYQDLAWRVLDAQFARVAQRRRRVFLVGHLGEGFSSAAVLFEPESMRGDTTSSRQKREELTRAARERTEATGFSWHMGGGSGNAANDEINRQGSTVCQGFIGEYGGATALGLSDDCTPTMTAKHPMDVLCMAHGQANAEIGGGGVSPTLTLLHEAPIIVQPPAMERMCSRPCAPPTAASASSTTSPSREGDSSSTTFDGVIAMADDNEKTAIDRDLMGTLKVGGGFR